VVEAARIVVVLSERDCPPCDLSSVFRAGREMRLAAVRGEWLPVQGEGYWTRSEANSGLELKLKHMCPWESV
jgi:hypothetical protein